MLGQEKTETEDIVCRGCGKSFTHKSSLDRHIQTCGVILKVADIEKERDQYKQQLEDPHIYLIYIAYYIDLVLI